MYLPPICRISQKRLNNATPCVTVARRPLLLVNALTPRPVGLLHDAFHRGQSAVSLTVSAQSLFRLRLWNKAHWGGYLAGVRAHPKTMSHCDSTETGQAPSTACITPLFISGDMVGSRHTRREKLTGRAADVSRLRGHSATTGPRGHRRVTTDSVCDQRRRRSGLAARARPCALARGPSRPAPCLPLADSPPNPPAPRGQPSP